MCTSDLIFDVGMHLGEDAEFDLEKGFRVVGIEADPALCAAVAGRLHGHVASGRLIIVNAAIAEEPGRATFYCDPDNSIWGTTEPAWVARNAGLGTRVERVEVDAVRMESIFAAHGVPYYMEVGIEGRDMLCVAALRDLADRPNARLGSA